MNGHELISSTSDVGFVTDREGTIHGWNQAAEESFDLAADEVLGRPCWEVLHGRDVFGNDYCGPHCPLLRMALGGGQVRRCQLFFEDRSGASSCYSVATLVLHCVEPSEPALVHLLHPAFWERRRQDESAAAPNGNHTRGELTAREREVLSALVEGKGTAEIARVLRISEKTVRNHVQSILYKLRVHSRLEAVALARDAELT